MLYATPPTFAAIEKKSTGVTLSSVLSEMRGLQIRNIERTRASGSKAQRFLEIQPYIAEKLVSLPAYGKHVQMCLAHMSKITANDTHRHDDICDTAADAIKIALIDKTLHTMHNKRTSATDVLSNLGSQMRRQNIARTRRDGVC
jgi:phage terminase large subunit-like protein